MTTYVILIAVGLVGAGVIYLYLMAKKLKNSPEVPELSLIHI